MQIGGVTNERSGLGRITHCPGVVEPHHGERLCGDLHETCNSAHRVRGRVQLSNLMPTRIHAQASELALHCYAHPLSYKMQTPQSDTHRYLRRGSGPKVSRPHRHPAPAPCVRPALDRYIFTVYMHASPSVLIPSFQHPHPYQHPHPHPYPDRDPQPKHPAPAYTDSS